MFTDDLLQWLAEKLDAARLAVRGSDRELVPMTDSPSVLPANTPLFHVPRQLVKVLNRDLAVAGIPKIDDRGRTLDIHALRHTFGTLLSKGGVAPRTAQAAMRHSRIDLTMNVYTDPKLLDVQGALGVLPPLPLDGTPQRKQIAATGTDDSKSSPLAPMLAPRSKIWTKKRSISWPATYAAGCRLTIADGSLSCSLAQVTKLTAGVDGTV